MAPIGKERSDILLLKMAQQGAPEIFRYIWETYPDLFTSEHVSQLSFGEEKSETKRLLSLNNRGAQVEGETLDKEIVSNIFNLIKDNEIDHLKQLLTPELVGRVGFGQLSWTL